MYTPTIIEQRRRAAGARYEHQIAQMLRGEGWEVEETGKLGVLDHGIDLVAHKDGMTRYVQCKCLSRWKTISENVVSQLYGSVAMQAGADNLETVQMYIYSPALLSSYAFDEAHKLNIHFKRVPSSRFRRN